MRPSSQVDDRAKPRCDLITQSPFTILIGPIRKASRACPIRAILAGEDVDNGSDKTVQRTLTDHLNTVRDIARYDSQTDTTAVVNHLIYDAFGNVTAETNSAVERVYCSFRRDR
jgi:hypothetical protein